MDSFCLSDSISSSSLFVSFAFLIIFSLYFCSISSFSFTASDFINLIRVSPASVMANFLSNPEIANSASLSTKLRSKFKRSASVRFLLLRSIFISSISFCILVFVASCAFFAKSSKFFALSFFCFSNISAYFRSASNNSICASF